MTQSLKLGYWYQRADERHGNVTRSYYWSEIKLEDPQVSFGVSKSMECDIFSSVL